jgi:hypothetical protein
MRSRAARRRGDGVLVLLAGVALCARDPDPERRKCSRVLRGQVQERRSDHRLEQLRGHVGIVCASRRSLEGLVPSLLDMGEQHHGGLRSGIAARVACGAGASPIDGSGLVGRCRVAVRLGLRGAAAFAAAARPRTQPRDGSRMEAHRRLDQAAQMLIERPREQGRPVRGEGLQQVLCVRPDARELDSKHAEGVMDEDGGGRWGEAR